MEFQRTLPYRCNEGSCYIEILAFMWRVAMRVRREVFTVDGPFVENVKAPRKGIIRSIKERTGKEKKRGGHQHPPPRRSWRRARRIGCLMGVTGIESIVVLAVLTFIDPGPMHRANAARLGRAGLEDRCRPCVGGGGGIARSLCCQLVQSW